MTAYTVLMHTHRAVNKWTLSMAPHDTVSGGVLVCAKGPMISLVLDAFICMLLSFDYSLVNLLRKSASQCPNVWPARLLR